MNDFDRALYAMRLRDNRINGYPGQQLPLPGFAQQEMPRMPPADAWRYQNVPIPTLGGDFESMYAASGNDLTRSGQGYPRTQMEMFGPRPVPDVVHPQRPPHLYGAAVADPPVFTQGGDFERMYAASGNGRIAPMPSNALSSQTYGMPLNRPALPGAPIDMGMAERVYPPPAVVPAGGALSSQTYGMSLNRPALPGAPIDMGMAERVYPPPAVVPGSVPAAVPPAAGPGFLARAGGVAARGLGALGALGMAADLFYTPQSDIDILNSAARQGRGRSQGADGPQTQGYSAGPVNSRGQGFTDPRLIQAPQAPAPVPRPAPVYQAPVNYDNGGVRIGGHAGIDDATRMAAMRALGIMP